MVTELKIASPLDQRRYERLRHPSEARISMGPWFWRRSFTGRVRNSSMNGIAIDLPNHVSVSFEDEVQVRWLVPAELSQQGQSKRYSFEGRVVRYSSSQTSSTQLGIRFEALSHEQAKRAEALAHRVIVGTLIAAVAIAILYLKSINVISFWYEPVFQTYSIAAAAFILSRVLLSFFYRAPADKGYLPAVSLIVAARNEENNILETIEHCYGSKYPKDLMEVIVIDDGSTDKTWDVLQSIATKFPNLHLHRFEKNQGKRHGMAWGAEKAKGKILVYVDSDSFLEPEGLYRIVQPFADPKVGAVAGHTRVRIQEDNFISKMESVRYYISHQIIKTAESIFGVVTCCPGAFSAYRRDLVVSLLPKWLNQTFLGTPATFGDDRSLTNYVLRTHRVLYHAEARCYTVVPDNWKTFFRQQLRWKKSWMRETTIASQIMLRKHPVAAAFYYIGVLVTLLSPIMAIRALCYLPWVANVSSLPYLTGLFLVYLMLCLLFFYRTRENYWFSGMAFAGLYLAFFSLQNYYAMLTVSKNHWGTR